jgi:hypothetical protein
MARRRVFVVSDERGKKRMSGGASRGLAFLKKCYFGK